MSEPTVTLPLAQYLDLVGVEKKVGEKAEKKPEPLKVGRCESWCGIDWGIRYDSVRCEQASGHDFPHYANYYPQMYPAYEFKLNWSQA